MLAETQLSFAIAKAACALASGNMNRFNEQTTKMVLSRDLKKKKISAFWQERGSLSVQSHETAPGRSSSFSLKHLMQWS